MPRKHSKKTKHNPTPKQTTGCCEVLRLLLRVVFVTGRPADKVLGSYFRRHRNYSSKDRRVIRNLCYSVFRWHGWLYYLAPQAFDKAREEARGNAKQYEDDNRNTDTASPDEITMPLGNKVCMTYLLGAAVMDSLLFQSQEAPVARDCAKRLGLGRNALAQLTDITSWKERWEEFCRQTGIQPPPADISDVIPAWAADHIALDEQNRIRLLTWLQYHPPLWLRSQTNTAEQVLADFREKGANPEMASSCPNAIKIGPQDEGSHSINAHNDGRFEVQDLASQAVGHICSPQPGERWWDACAGAGGKTLHLADLMANKGTVIATDVRDYKLGDLKKRARKAQFSNIAPKTWDGKGVRPKKANFDGVLVDAPCSCSGTWRSAPDARWSSTPEERDSLASLQQDILSKAASGVKPGGVLVYATCSLFEKENQSVVTTFLNDHPEFTPAPFRNPVTDKEVPEGMTQIWPWDGDCDAMFAARIRRNNGK